MCWPRSTATSASTRTPWSRTSAADRFPSCPAPLGPLRNCSDIPRLVVAEGKVEMAALKVRGWSVAVLLTVWCACRPSALQGADWETTKTHLPRTQKPGYGGLGRLAVARQTRAL